MYQCVIKTTHAEVHSLFNCILQGSTTNVGDTSCKKTYKTKSSVTSSANLVLHLFNSHLACVAKVVSTFKLGAAL